MICWEEDPKGNAWDTAPNKCMHQFAFKKKKEERKDEKLIFPLFPLLPPPFTVAHYFLSPSSYLFRNFCQNQKNSDGEKKDSFNIFQDFFPFIAKFIYLQQKHFTVSYIGKQHLQLP